MPCSVAELLAYASERHGQQRFCRRGDAHCTVGEFVLAVRRVGAVLRSRGVEAGDRVAILLPRSTDEAVALLATMWIGGMAVPIHGKLKDDQVRHVLGDAAPRLCITSAERTVALRDPAAVLAGQQVLDEAELWGAEADEDVPAALPQAPAVLLYTSGSTGRAKGIVQTQGNLLAGAGLVADYLGLTREDHILVLLSLSFDYGLNQLLTALLVGCRWTAVDHLGVGELASLLEAHRPTGLAGVPSLWHEVAAGLTGDVLTDAHGGSLRYITNSGGALGTDDLRTIRRRWPHVSVYAMYGLTEAFRSAYLPPEELDAHPDSFGYALDGVELLLVSPDDGRVLLGPATGELVHAGALVASGYWRRPEDDAVRFRPDPRGGGGRVVYSGDLVRRDEAGRHYFVSRLDRMLKVHGHRISPDEVLQALDGLPGVGASCAFGLDAGANGHRIALCFVGDPQDAELLAAVRRRCRARLPSYMVPAVVRAFAALPHTANGKVDVPALCAMLAPCTDGTSPTC